jgi:glycosyltransferase involved in cell wall biosynthesis
MSLRVAVDARSTQGPALGGVGRALAHVIPIIATDPSVDALTLLTAAEGEPTRLGPREVALRTPRPRVATAWLQLAAPLWLRHHRDVIFHCDWYGLPYLQPVPMTATIHDLTFEHRPEWFSTGHRLSYRLQARHAARTARCLITPSEFVRQDVATTYGVDPERIVVAPRAVSTGFAPAAEDSAFRATLPDTYVVTLSGAARRRADVAVASWRAAGRPAELVVVGPREGPDEPGLRWIGRIDDTSWTACLAGAAALLYTTEDEGFGLPALEAIASGTPVVCARVGSLPEVLGPCAAWADGTDPLQYATALNALLSDRAAAESLRSAGLQRADEGPTWHTCAEAYVKAFAKAVT